MTGKWHVKADAPKVFDHTVHIRPGMPQDAQAGYDRPIEGQPDPWKPWDTQFGGYWKGANIGVKLWRRTHRLTCNRPPKATSRSSCTSHSTHRMTHGNRPRNLSNRYPLDRITVPENFLPDYPYKEDIGCGHRSA